jgi:NCAIR mutase (PurE)-related protein
MDARSLREYLEKLKGGELSVDEAVRRISDSTIQHVGDFAQLDGERALRQGFPEVVFGERKRPEQIGALVEKLVAMARPCW